MGGFRKGGFSNNRFFLKPDVAIASEVSILSKNSLAITDFHAKKTQHVQLFEDPLPGTPPIRDSQLKSGALLIGACPPTLAWHSGSGFGPCKTVPAGPVPLSVPGKLVPTSRGPGYPACLKGWGG